MRETKMKRKTCSDPATQRERGRRFALSAVLAGGLVTAAFVQFVMPQVAKAVVFASMEAPTPAQRVVQGRVLDKKDAPIIGAVVYLKDTRSLSVKSYLTDETGRFHFGQLADGADYEVWAEQNGKRSSSKSISQFNSKLDIQFTLKIDLSN